MQGLKETETLSVSDHGAKWLRELENLDRSTETVKLYDYCLTYFGRWLESVGISVRSFTREDAQEWLASMRAGRLSPATVRQRIQVVTGFYAWLVSYDYLAKNPMFLLGKIKVKRKLPQVLKPSDIQRLLDACVDARERMIVEVLYATGCRRGEMLAMRFRDLDLDGRTVLIHGKGGKERIGKLTPSAVAAIRKWLDEREAIAAHLKVPTDHLLIGRRGALKKTQLLNIVYKIAERAGYDGRVWPHLFRHSYAVGLMDRGFEIQEVSELLGHANLQTTQLYTQVSMPSLHAKYDRLHPRAERKTEAFPPPPTCPACGHAGHWGSCHWTTKAPAPLETCRCEISAPKVRGDDGGQLRLFVTVLATLLPMIA